MMWIVSLVAVLVAIGITAVILQFTTQLQLDQDNQQIHHLQNELTHVQQQLNRLQHQRQ
jgi:uncharacterized membrane-anchored protein YhcB (DUF1043 family)